MLQSSNIYLMATSLDASFGTASEEINCSPQNLFVFFHHLAPKSYKRYLSNLNTIG